MLNAISSFLLVTVPVSGNSTTTIALVLGGVALVVALAAYSKARRVSAGQQVETVSEVSSAVDVVSGVLAVEDDRQIVAVITAAIAAILAGEAETAGASGLAGAAGAVGAAKPLGGVRGIRNAVGNLGTTNGTGSGPYAGFVVRRIRRV